MASKEFVLEEGDSRVVTVVQKPSGWRNRFVYSSMAATDTN
jgi:hypothetical protein